MASPLEEFEEGAILVIILAIVGLGIVAFVYAKEFFADGSDSISKAIQKWIADLLAGIKLPSLPDPKSPYDGTTPVTVGQYVDQNAAQGLDYVYQGTDMDNAVYSGADSLGIVPQETQNQLQNVVNAVPTSFRQDPADWLQSSGLW